MVSGRLIYVVIATLACGLNAPLAQPGPPHSYSPPGMTTDGRDYCDHLVGEFAHEQRVRPVASSNAQMLAEEGRDMCARGHLRGGIERLRRALVLLREGG